MQRESWRLARASALALLIGDYPPSRCVHISNWVTRKLFTFPPRTPSFLLTLPRSGPSTEHWELGACSQPPSWCGAWNGKDFLTVSLLTVNRPSLLPSVCGASSSLARSSFLTPPVQWALHRAYTCAAGILNGGQHVSEVFRNREGHSHCHELPHDLLFIWTDPNCAHT